MNWLTLAFDMTPETAVVVSIIFAVGAIGSGIWYFLPGKTRRFLAACYQAISVLWRWAATEKAAKQEAEKPADPPAAEEPPKDEGQP